MTTTTGILLTTVEVKPFGLHGEDGVEPTQSVDVTVDENGLFHATMNGEEYRAPSLDSLKNYLVTAVTGAKLSVPFVTTDGRRGTIRGWHAGNHDVLVTWDDGTKGRIGTWENVARDATPEQLAALAEARDAYDAAKDAVKTAEEGLRKVTLRSGGVRVTELMLETLGFDITDRDLLKGQDG